jgi:Fur family ferric uptake transcriptional regulator
MGIKRKTKSVDFILNEFQKDREAISATDLVHRLSSNFNKTTVYRVLEKLEQDGILHSFNGKRGMKLYAKCYGCNEDDHIDVHPHFECSACAQIECLDVEISIPTVADKKISKAAVLLQGLCSNCIL